MDFRVSWLAPHRGRQRVVGDSTRWGLALKTQQHDEETSVYTSAAPVELVLVLQLRQRR